MPEAREELYRRFVSLLLVGDGAHIAPVPAGVQLRSLHYLAGRQMLLLDFSESLAGAFPGGTAAELSSSITWSTTSATISARSRRSSS